MRENIKKMGCVNFKKYIEKIGFLESLNRYNAHENTTLKTEQVYLMVSLLTEQWGPISRVQKSVLQLFHDLLPINGIRSLEFYAASFRGIKEGKITESNVPKINENDALMRHIILPKNWLRTEEEKGPSTECGRDDFVYIETIIK